MSNAIPMDSGWWEIFDNRREQDSVALWLASLILMVA
jgi:hypothetical protein